MLFARDHAGGGEELSAASVRRIGACTTLLGRLCDPMSGHVPVLGPNDGALLLPLNACGYRDFRPVVQAMSVLLNQRRVLPSGPWDEDLYWLGLGEDATGASSGTTDVDVRRTERLADGYWLLEAGASRMFFRCPTRLQFRPHHSDQLHLDLWSGGVNVLMDGGSFSYNDELMPYFRSPAAHNTVQFDDRDQMPVLGRFLYGKWLTASVTNSTREDGRLAVEAACRDYAGAEHERAVTWVPADGTEAPPTTDEWIIEDRMFGFRSHATLRWRLNPKYEWTLAGSVCQSEACRIEIESEGDVDLNIVDGWVSWYYSQKAAVRVLEVTTRASPSAITSRITVLSTD